MMNLKPKPYKRPTKQQVLRNRKILGIISSILYVLGFGTILYASGCDFEVQFKSIVIMVLIGSSLASIGHLGFMILDSTNGGKK